MDSSAPKGLSFTKFNRATSADTVHPPPVASGDASHAAAAEASTGPKRAVSNLNRGPRLISIKNFRSIRSSAAELASNLARDYRVPSSSLFALKWHIRLLRSLDTVESRRDLVSIKLLAIRAGACNRFGAPEIPSHLLRDDPKVLQHLADLVKAGSVVTVRIQTDAVRALRSLWGWRSVSAKLKDLGILQQGLVPMTLHRCIDVLSSPDPPGGYVHLAHGLLWWAADLVGSAHTSSSIDPGEVMDLVLLILRNNAMRFSGILAMCCHVLQSVFSARNGNTHTARFHENKGLELCLDRIKSLLHVPATLDAVSTAPRSTAAAGPDLLADADRGAALFEAAPGVRRSVLSLFMALCHRSFERQRTAVRSNYLKDGTFSSILLHLWRGCFAISRHEYTAGRDSSGPTSMQLVEPLQSSGVRITTSSSPDNTSLFWGPEVFASSCELLCSVIHNNPSLVKHLHNEGITDGFLRSLAPVRIRGLCTLIVFP